MATNSPPKTPSFNHPARERAANVAAQGCAPVERDAARLPLAHKLRNDCIHRRPRLLRACLCWQAHHLTHHLPHGRVLVQRPAVEHRWLHGLPLLRAGPVHHPIRKRAEQPHSVIHGVTFTDWRLWGIIRGLDGGRGGMVGGYGSAALWTSAVVAVFVAPPLAVPLILLVWIDLLRIASRGRK